jgi:hypothetical protein
MNTRIVIFALAALALSSAGCIEFRQPKEFKNRKMKEDPPLLNEAPHQPRLLAFKPAAILRERV